MDAIQQVFEYQGTQIRTVTRDGNPWFVAADVCRILEITNYRNAVGRLNDRMKGVHTVDTLGGPQETLIINEAGVYKLTFTSRKPEAEKFTDWLAEEVIPAIRKTGTYSTTHTYDNDVLHMMGELSRGVDVATMGKQAQSQYFKMQAAIAKGLPASFQLATAVPSRRRPGASGSVERTLDNKLRELLSHAVPVVGFDPASEMQLKSSVLFDDSYYYVLPFAAQHYLGIKPTDSFSRNRIYAHIRSLGGGQGLKKFVHYRHVPPKPYRTYLVPRAAVDPITAAPHEPLTPHPGAVQ